MSQGNGLAGRPLSFSVVVPTRNRHHQLAECLASLAEQDYPADRFEVVVVDDGSDPPISSVACSFEHRMAVRVVRRQHDGPGAARNAGADAATGDCIAFTDDDCTVSAGWLSAYAKALAEHPDALLSGPIVNGLDDNVFAATSQVLVDYLYGYYNRNVGRATFLTSNNLAVARAKLREVGGFDPIFVHAAGEDRELSSRWAHLGRPAFVVPDAVVTHRHHMGLQGFVRQHFGYGRGALYFHIKEAERGNTNVRIEPRSFYTDMLRAPRPHANGPAATTMSGLLIVSQAANAAGYFWEKHIGCKRRGPASRVDAPQGRHDGDD